MLPFWRRIALCFTIVLGCAVLPNLGLAQPIQGGLQGGPVPVSRPPHTAGLWTAVGIGSAFVGGAIVLGAFGAKVGRYDGPDCSDQVAGTGCSQASIDAQNRKYWRLVGSSLGLGLVGLAVGVWGIVGLRKTRRVRSAQAALQHFDLTLDPRAPQLSWGARF